MKCEVEFLPVGEKSKPGDAIIVRYGNENSFDLMLIDGGHAETADQICTHLEAHFPGKRLKHVVLTHPDLDHASGLRGVLERIPVENLWMHHPWNHVEEARRYFKDQSSSIQTLQRAIRNEYPVLVEIEALAAANGTNRPFAFQGAQVGPFLIASPPRATYALLMAQFYRTPEPNTEVIEEAIVANQVFSLSKFYKRVAGKIQVWATEGWETERLRDGGVTSAENESSIVLYGAFEAENRILLTGDSGTNALNATADYLESVGQPLRKFSMFQIPHHGSRSNVGPEILNRLVGRIQPENTTRRLSALVSSPVDDETHPRKMVVNAFARRAATVVATQGNKTVHYGGFSARPGYGNAVPLPFYTSVEDYDS